MEKIKLFAHHGALPTDLHKRIEMVVAACIAHGHVNRDVLIASFKLTPLQASVLLRDFLQVKSKEIRRDAHRNGYVLTNFIHKHVAPAKKEQSY